MRRVTLIEAEHTDVSIKSDASTTRQSGSLPPDPGIMAALHTEEMTDTDHRHNGDARTRNEASGLVTLTCKQCQDYLAEGDKWSVVRT